MNWDDLNQSHIRRGATLMTKAPLLTQQFQKESIHISPTLAGNRRPGAIVEVQGSQTIAGTKFWFTTDDKGKESIYFADELLRQP